MDGPWPVTDGIVSLRPPGPDDTAILVAGRDHEWQRWLGPGSPEPAPTACVLVTGEVVGWVDFDRDQDWLGPREVNIGYNIFGPHRRKGYAARAVCLLLHVLRERTDAERAYLVIGSENVASRGVARSVGAVPVEPVADLSGRSNIWHSVELT